MPQPGFEPSSVELHRELGPLKDVLPTELNQDLLLEKLSVAALRLLNNFMGLGSMNYSNGIGFSN